MASSSIHLTLHQWALSLLKYRKNKSPFPENYRISPGSEELNDPLVDNILNAINSVRLVSEAHPEYLSTLVLMLPQGDGLMQEGFGGQFEPLSQRELLEETLMFLEQLELKKTIFRSDHASNYLVLKGVLGRDKERMVSLAREALNESGAIKLRPEWARGL